MKNYGKQLWFLRFIGAFILAFILLNIFCLIYFNVAVHRPTSTGATDYVWESNKFYASAKEGFAFGITDKDGYNNIYPHKQDQKIDILVMGSSHMEAFQVSQDENATYLLNKQLHDRGNNDFAYNIGISGHDFLRCAANLSSALNTFKPTKYVIIETGSVSFSESSVDAVLNGSFPKIASHDEGIIGCLQRIPYLRLIYQQLESFIGINEAADTVAEDSAQTIEVTPSYTESFNRLIQEVSETAKKASVKLIVIYHPEILLNADSSLHIDTNPDYLKLFSNACSANGVIFVDMSNKFLSEYQSQRIIPYGFSNTAVGVGHLNKDGHRMVAEMLYQVIAEDETGVK